MTIPNDLDQLMWLLAESDDKSAIDEFGKRFPDLREELARRNLTVRNLKRAKPGDHTGATPAFSIRPAPPGRNLMPLWASLACVLLVALSFATFKATRSMMAKPEPMPTHVDLSTPKIENVPVQNDGGYNSRVRPDNSVPKTDETLPPDAVPPLQNNVPVADKPQTVKLNGAPLQSAISMIATQCQIEVEIAPKMPNPEVSIEFDGMTGAEMLKQLGKTYNFSVLQQGDHKYLLIPAMPWTDPL